MQQLLLQGLEEKDDTSLIKKTLWVAERQHTVADSLSSSHSRNPPHHHTHTHTHPSASTTTETQTAKRLFSILDCWSWRNNPPALAWVWVCIAPSQGDKGASVPPSRCVLFHLVEMNALYQITHLKHCRADISPKQPVRQPHHPQSLWLQDSKKTPKESCRIKSFILTSMMTFRWKSSNVREQYNKSFLKYETLYHSDTP